MRFLECSRSQNNYIIHGKLREHLLRFIEYPSFRALLSLDSFMTGKEEVNYWATTHYIKP